MARQKNHELRQKIIKAAYRKFMQDDYNSIYLKDIARECDISVSLLHHYFPTKADIIIHIIYDMLLKMELFIQQKHPETESVLPQSPAFSELVNRMFVNILVRNNNQMLQFYSHVLCDARLMNRVVDFCFAYLTPNPISKDTFEKRYELYVYYGSFAQTALLYMDNRLPCSLYEAAVALHRRWYFSLGYTAEETNALQKNLDKIATPEFLEEFYQEYLLSLDDFVICEW